MFGSRTPAMPAPQDALPGRATSPFTLAARHAVLDAPLVTTDIPEGFEVAIFGLGCFWGAEEAYWAVPGVWSTSVGYAGGYTPHPTYEEVCSGRTGHTEAVRIVFDPAVVTYDALARIFLEIHDPTQVMRQGNDVGTQYRSAAYVTSPEQEATILALIAAYQPVLTEAGWGDIATEVAPAGAYFYAEDRHQQYLHKVPWGYRCHSVTGLKVP